MCYKLVDQYESTTTSICTQGQSGLECDSLVYGCLIKGLRSLNLYPKRAEVSEVKQSVVAFDDSLRSLTCLVLPRGLKRSHDSMYASYKAYDSYNEDVHHSNCSFTLAFAKEISSIIDRKEPSGVLEAHLAHIHEKSDNRM